MSQGFVYNVTQWWSSHLCHGWLFKDIVHISNYLLSRAIAVGYMYIFAGSFQ